MLEAASKGGRELLCLSDVSANSPCQRRFARRGATSESVAAAATAIQKSDCKQVVSALPRVALRTKIELVNVQVPTVLCSIRPLVEAARNRCQHQRCRQKRETHFEKPLNGSLKRKFNIVNLNVRHKQETIENLTYSDHADQKHQLHVHLHREATVKTNPKRTCTNKCSETTLLTSLEKLSKFSLTNKIIALIYIVFTSLTASQQNLCSSTQTPTQVVATSFYWPTSIVNHQFDFQHRHHQQQQQQQQQQQEHLPAQIGSTNNDDNLSQQQVVGSLSLRSIANGSNRRSLSSAAAAAAAATAAALATANAALARKGQSRNLMIGQNFNNFSSAVPYSVMMQDVDYTSGQEDAIINEPTHHLRPFPFESPLLPVPAGPLAPNDGTMPLVEAADASQLSPERAIISMMNSSTNQFITNSLPNDSLSSSSLSEIHGLHFVDATSPTSGGGGSRSAPAVITKSTRRKTATDRALLPLDSNRLILPQMQQIKARFNQGCVGGTKCQFFAFCWMSGGSLGASCGLLMTCCVTPSKQEIQPGFYGPVVNDPYCGRSTSKINRIVGGTDASFGQFPWQAFVQVGGSRCGGALISSRHVVTAGHCVARFTPQADRYDVAVLELDRTASYKDNIKPICLPQKDATFVGRVAYVAGWGALQAGSKLRPKVLQHVAVPVIENHVCESWHRRKGIDIRIYDEMMCAGYELGQRDACQGDSGGPLMLNQFGVWYLVGIVSAGYSCAKQYQPGIYHRVSSSSDWISSNVYQQGSSK